MNADILADRSHDWARALCELYGAAAAHELIQNYRIYTTGREGHNEAGRRQRHLEETISDGALDPHGKVRLILVEIGGEFHDALYLRSLDDKIEKWRQIERLKRETETPALERPPTSPALPPSPLQPELPAGQAVSEVEPGPDERPNR